MKKQLFLRLRLALTGLFCALLATNAGCVCMLVVPVKPFQEALPTPRQDDNTEPPPRELPPPPTEDCLQVLTTLAQFGPTQIRCDTPRVKEVVLRHNGHEHCPQAIQINDIRIEQDQEKTGFRVHNAPALPFTLTADNNLTLQVAYKAHVLLTEQARLVVSTDHPDQPKLQSLLEAQGVDEMVQRDSYQQQISKTDVLFVVDASRSMRHEQANLIKNFADFMQWATRLESDFQVGVLPITVSDDEPSCLLGDPKILTNKTTNLQEAFAKKLNSLGTHSGREQGLETAFRALSLPWREQKECNGGFMRKDAVLSVVFVSDEPDQSDRSYEFYRDFFAKLKGEGNKSRVRISAVVGPDPNGCSSSVGRAKAGPRYLNLAKEFQGISASICDEDWAKALERIGLNSILQQLKFKLKAQPEPDTIAVTVDQKSIPKSDTNGWEYLPDSNEVLFRGSHVPVPGAQIEIRYTIQCPKTP